MPQTTETKTRNWYVWRILFISSVLAVLFLMGVVNAVRYWQLNN